ncbi:hypothetical protein RHS01_11492 [Rhizoctonia solani]|uniref:Uncharacterized protein n=1 Tax=Rhizoctonia solani TaxID=456999 RepID=A0A8H7I4V3_9AGAM|nr:hypothetical protein RHS01_11492 [Rhizoctonia solani]
MSDTGQQEASASYVPTRSRVDILGTCLDDCNPCGTRPKANAEAERLIGKLCRRDDETLGEFKHNGWNKAARVVFEFALLLDEHIYDKEGGPAPESDDEDTVVLNPQTTVSHASPWHILKSVIDIFDKWIAKMDVA